MPFFFVVPTPCASRLRLIMNWVSICCAWLLSCLSVLSRAVSYHSTGGVTAFTLSDALTVSDCSNLITHASQITRRPCQLALHQTLFNAFLCTELRCEAVSYDLPAYDSLSLPPYSVDSPLQHPVRLHLFRPPIDVMFRLANARCPRGRRMSGKTARS